MVKKKKAKIDDVFASNVYHKTDLKLSAKIVPADIFIICVPEYICHTFFQIISYQYSFKY
jgi:hypothetical protein